MSFRAFFFFVLLCLNLLYASIEIEVFSPIQDEIYFTPEVLFNISASSSNSVESITCDIYINDEYNTSLEIINGEYNSTLILFDDGYYDTFFNCTDGIEYNETDYISFVVRLYGCVGSSYIFGCGETITESCTLNGNVSTYGWGDCFYIDGNNIVVDCNGNYVVGEGSSIGIGFIVFSNDATIKNCNIINFEIGIYTGSWYFNFFNNSLSSVKYGVYINGGRYGNISRNNISGVDYGIYLYSPPRFKRPVSYNEISRNIITGASSCGIYLSSTGTTEDNLFYDNFFNNSCNAIVNNYHNYWSIPLRRGENIIGGIFQGGNFWATPNRTGWSQTCNSTLGNGICDNPYYPNPMNFNNIDFYPLTKPKGIAQPCGFGYGGGVTIGDDCLLLAIIVGLIGGVIGYAAPRR